MKPKQLSLLDKADIAFYIPQKFAKKNYKRGSKAFGWAGMAMLKDVLQRNGHIVDYCDKNTVHEHKIIMVSLVSAIDWYEFIKERMQWQSGNYTVILGGAGLDNIRPFLEFADIFVWGRAENIILPLVEETLANNKYNHPSVCYSVDFSQDNRYEFCQPLSTYPHQVTLTNNKKWCERAIGCQRKCLFCNYTWTRKHLGLNQSESGSAKSLWGSSVESTIFELDLDNPESWPKGAHATFGIDGLSERLRFMVNKPITNEMIERFLTGILVAYGNAKSHIIKWYQIVGFPTEKEQDWIKFRDILWNSNEPRIFLDSNVAKVYIHHTPFKPTPCTPVACWPIAYTNYRDIIVPKLQHENCYQYKYGLYAGTTIDFNTTYGTESLPTIAQWMIVFRGIESDTELIKKLVTSKAYKNGNVETKLKWLNQNTDIDRFFRAYQWSKLPTRYLHTHTPYSIMSRMADARLRKYGGEEGVKLADYIGVVQE